MLIALNANGVPSLPVLSGERGTCPGCGSPVVAHCGAIKDWYWAHLASARDCDPWYEPEGDWHRGWKATLTGNDPARMEVTVRDPVGGKWHRADAMSSDGWVIELQRSKITALQMAEREDFYGSHTAGMVWLFEGEVFENPFDTEMGTRDNRILRAHSPSSLIRATPRRAVARCTASTAAARCTGGASGRARHSRAWSRAWASAHSSPR